MLVVSFPVVELNAPFIFFEEKHVNRIKRKLVLTLTKWTNHYNGCQVEQIAFPLHRQLTLWLHASSFLKLQPAVDYTNSITFITLLWCFAVSFYARVLLHILKLWLTILISGSPTRHTRVSPLMTKPINHFYNFFFPQFIAITKRRENMFSRGSLFYFVLEQHQKMDENTASNSCYVINAQNVNFMFVFFACLLALLWHLFRCSVLM